MLDSFLSSLITQTERGRYIINNVPFVVFLSHHSRGLQGAAGDEMLFAWLKGVAYDFDSHTPGWTQQRPLNLKTVLQRSQRTECQQNSLHETEYPST